MKIRNKHIKKLLEKYKEISILGKVNSLLGWDLNVNLPPKAAEGRAAQVAYITKLTAEKWLETDFRHRLESLNNQTGSKSLNLEEGAILRNLNWAAKYYYQVPKEIIVEFAETTSRAFMVWQKAKLDNKFKDFLPHLEKIINLNQIIAQHLGYKENPYDALLDLYEPGLTASFCKKIFADLCPK
ncbi:MAG: carboxypeptidase M32, partial [Patescibacteria group bacterium]